MSVPSSPSKTPFTVKREKRSLGRLGIAPGEDMELTMSELRIQDNLQRYFNARLNAMHRSIQLDIHGCLDLVKNQFHVFSTKGEVASALSRLERLEDRVNHLLEAESEMRF